MIDKTAHGTVKRMIIKDKFGDTKIIDPYDISVLSHTTGRVIITKPSGEIYSIHTDNPDQTRRQIEQYLTNIYSSITGDIETR